MYELIKKILEKSKETGKDIGVAYDILRAEGDEGEDLKNASDFLNDNQVAILKLHNAGKEDKLKELCDLSGDKEAVRKYIIALFDNGVIER